MDRETSYDVAWFTLRTWAQRYPARAFDLGSDVALRVVDYLMSRNVRGVDAMHEAIDREEQILRLRVAIATTPLR